MKYAFVTGSTKGIGKAIGLKLLQEGYFVVFNYSNSEESAEHLKAEISVLYSDHFSILKADLSDLNQVEIVATQLRQLLPKIDLLVFNAGLTDRSPLGEVKQKDWLSVFNANVNVPFFLLQELVPNITKGGNIIFIGSMLGNIPHSASISYGVTKSAIHSLVKNMVKFLSQDKIRINAIAPGFVDTDWQKDKPEWLREKIKSKIALKRFAKEEEVANICHQITQNEYLTGQVIQLDGGYNYE
ncbi:SDR family NAD(P)-dependent oxidoreductase [Labilibaculum antarcticum]|uniref:Short-chain dehydrogenase n=1 Tax=Labilibaculum antarcticum TaxID=1717717 RepID=A0A1Y1CE22_9BACT|nr:SDR family oxidoreductase [Labilibaculum antarcticum]BAX78587.1 short-chain dehydrogenase [Labilibaculum antarcticum]